MLLSILLQAVQAAEAAAATVLGGQSVRGIIAIATGLVVIGAALGLGKIGKSAMEGIARQPEAASNIRTSMILIGALVEGVALFAIVVCFVAVNK